MEWTDLKFFNDGTFEKVWERVQDERKRGKIILPQNREIFNALELTSFNDVNVVIVGQDPYPTADPPHAHGLAFSVVDEIKPFPKSLRNIFEEIQADVGSPIPETGNLTRWAEQGVLLLNTFLTVIEKLPLAHADVGWHYLSSQAIQALSEHRKHIVFMLWGVPARRKARLIDDTKHLILESGHPSPLSANRGLWFGNKHFSKANEYLIAHDRQSIQW